MNTAIDDADELLSRISEATGQSQKELIDNITRVSGMGSLSDAYQMMLRGINHRGLGNPVKSVKDNRGIVLFTRPDCNLSYDNIGSNRLLTPLLSSEPMTLQRYFRSILDVRGTQRNETARTPLVDPTNPYIPLLTNSLISTSGWQDIAPEVYTSKEGVMKEVWSMLDGTYRVTNAFQLTANFRNVEGNPILGLISTWLLYATSVKFNFMDPYPDNISENRIDYQTRIYHLLLDPSRRFVVGTAATAASFPVSCPMGAAFNYVGDSTFTEATEQVSIQFQSVGTDYNDPITIEEMNRLAAKLNPDLAIVRILEDDMIVATEASGDGSYVRLPRDMITHSNYHGVPLIHPFTFELYWYVSREEYNQLAAGIGV